MGGRLKGVLKLEIIVEGKGGKGAGKAREKWMEVRMKSWTDASGLASAAEPGGTASHTRNILKRDNC